ncbi:MAG: translation elongation factor Ts [Candidatus Eisenbacteria bacterium]|nr:translation elongation factor Ts [Candidatus Eisenbacteria bacterium]
MAEITATLVKELRERTGVGMMECKKALSETGGDLEKAAEHLRKMGAAQAAKKADRATRDGLVESYIHPGGRLGVLIEVNCETDFVARTDDFKLLVHNLAMHVAAARPQWVRREDVPAEILDKEREIYREQMVREGKPANIMDKIVDGKINKFYEETCLLEQPYIRDPDRKVNQVVQDAVGKIGENIQVRRFGRFELGA